MLAETQQLLARFRTTRANTLALVAGASAEDLQVQSMPDASPGKWHLAHTSWFFACFVLDDKSRESLRERDLLGADANQLFNSYYESVGQRQPRASRGQLSRPSLDAVKEYRRRIDAAIEETLSDSTLRSHHANLIELGLAHEEQHQELILTDLYHLLACQPTSPALRAAPQRSHPGPGSAALGSGRLEDHTQPTEVAPPANWMALEEGMRQIGSSATPFHFDNEAPRHPVYQPGAFIGRSLVTNAAWLQFMADDGYTRPELWLSEGWSFLQDHQIRSPYNWRREGDNEPWRLYTLHGVQDLDEHAPVCQISYFEADAFARWCGARLPTEQEWELAASDAQSAGALANLDVDPMTIRPQRDRRLVGWLTPRPSEGLSGEGEETRKRATMRGLFGEVWQWTSSAYVGYPGFRAGPGAVGEYNGKFMINQQVLRGSSCFTAPGHSRTTYRNFFPTHTRWQLAGLRLARDA